MPYLVKVIPSADKDLADLPSNVRKRILQKLTTLEQNPRPAGAIKMQGYDDMYRLRVGDYRVIYQIEDEVLYVYVIRIGHRREIYKKFKR